MYLRGVPGTALIGAACSVTALALAPPVPADTVAYLVNVTVRPGYNFPSADAALAYGNAICERVRQAAAYSDVVGEVKNDFNTNDDYQAAYLINQAVNELCPALIWQLRNSAVHYTGGPDLGS